jgi:rhodanese-related sulfurtransferase
MNKRITISNILLLLTLLVPPNLLAHIDVTPQQAKEMIASNPDLLIVDVREESEYCGEGGHIPGAVNYPAASGVLEERYAELPLNEDILVVCRTGHRSNAAAEFLDQKGFASVYDMTGGMNAWEYPTTQCIDICPAEVLLSGKEDQLCILRRVRDEILLQDNFGSVLTRLYYFHAPEVSTMLDKYPYLQEKTGRVLDDIIPFINSLLDGNSVTINNQTIIDLGELLDEMVVKASPRLKAFLKLLKRIIKIY